MINRVERLLPVSSRSRAAAPFFQPFRPSLNMPPHLSTHILDTALGR